MSKINIKDWKNLVQDEMIYRNLSPQTIQRYIFEIQNFIKNTNKPIGKICPEDIHKYMVDSIKRGLSISTVVVKKSALRIFAQRCLKIPHLELAFPKTKIKRRVPKVASVDEIKFLISCAKSLRDQTILLTLFATGMRTKELTHLQIQDINSKDMIIYIRQGKGQKDRIVPLSNELLLALRHYYRIYKPGKWIFPNQMKDGPLPCHTIGRIWNFVKKRAGLNIIGGVHLLRHCFATHLLDAQVNLNSIQRVLGHSSISSTSRYLAFTKTAANECAKKIEQIITNPTKIISN